MLKDQKRMAGPKTVENIQYVVNQYKIQTSQTACFHV